MEQVRVAILDLYAGTPGRGMGNLKRIVEEVYPPIVYDIFDVRQHAEVPDLSYDIYISSGGPGDPREGDGVWDKAYFDWVDALLAHNRAHPHHPKYAFFICHSFQMLCHHLKMGRVSKRPKKSFGVFPVEKTAQGKDFFLFRLLNDPFYVADFRSYQIRPNLRRIDELGVEILAMELEDMRLHRYGAMMALRITDHIIATQFHPEADPEGMMNYAVKDDWRNIIISQYGEEIYREMIDHLEDPQKIDLTFKSVLPVFLHQAANAVSRIPALV